MPKQIYMKLQHTNPPPTPYDNIKRKKKYNEIPPMTYISNKRRIYVPLPLSGKKKLLHYE